MFEFKCLKCGRSYYSAASFPVVCKCSNVISIVSKDEAIKHLLREVEALRKENFHLKMKSQGI